MVEDILKIHLALLNVSIIPVCTICALSEEVKQINKDIKCWNISVATLMHSAQNIWCQVQTNREQKKRLWVFKTTRKSVSFVNCMHTDFRRTFTHLKIQNWEKQQRNMFTDHLILTSDFPLAGSNDVYKWCVLPPLSFHMSQQVDHTWHQVYISF